MSESEKSPGGGRILVGGERMSESTDRARGGGEKFHPNTFEDAQTLLAPQVRSLQESAHELDDSLRAQRVVFEATVLPNYLANSYFPDRLVELLDLTSLGSRPATGTLRLPSASRETTTKSLIVASDEVGFERLSALLEDGGRTKTERAAADELRQFAELRLPRVDEIVGRDTVESLPWTDEKVVFEAVLHPDPDSSTGGSRRPLSEPIFDKFRALVERLEGEVLANHRDVVGGLTFVPILLPVDRLDAVAAFNPLRSIRRMPRVRPVPAAPLRSAARVTGSVPPPPDTSAPEVLIFDAGVDASASFFCEAVVTEDLTNHPPIPGCLEHGSGVTGAVLYGNVEPSQSLRAPIARVRHLRAVPGPDTDPAELYWLLDQIRDTILASESQLVNLSLGPEVALEDGEPHRWTAVLDELAYERDVLFVTAAGNNGEGDSELGLNRVQVPADMVNGLAVGACDVPHPEQGWLRASYSAIGPGRPGARIQPGGVAFGGHPTRPFARLSGDGRLSYDWGTSYATPLAVHGLAGLITELGEHSTAPMLRAMAIHFAEAHPAKESQLEVGHGRFLEDYTEVLQCPASEVTVLYQTTIERQEVLAFQLPVPEQIDRGKVQLRWTLAYASPTDPAEAVEYTKVGLEAVLRPHAAIYSYRDPFDVKKTEKVDILNQPDRVAELIKAGWKQSQNPVTRSPKGARAGEGARREDGKWETVWRSEDTLLASSLWHPRLDINQVAREGGALARETAAVDFALIVTVRSTAGLPVYAEARAEFPILTELPVALPVQIRT